MALDPARFKMIGTYGPIPRFDHSKLPPNESELAKELNFVLWELDHQIVFFQHSVELLKYASGEFFRLLKANGSPDQKLNNWELMAAHSAVLTVFHVDNLLSRVGMTARRCATIQPHVNYAKLKEAGRIFRGHFPDAKAQRNTVGHIGEQRIPYAMANDIKPGPIRTIRGAFISGRFETTHADGRILKCPMNSTAIDKLIASKETAYAGLWEAANVIAGMPA